MGKSSVYRNGRIDILEDKKGFPKTTTVHSAFRLRQELYLQTRKIRLETASFLTSGLFLNSWARSKMSTPIKTLPRD